MFAKLVQKLSVQGSLFRILYNAFWSLTGQTGALLAALFAFPVVLHNLGPDLFGLVSLVWLMVGYFGIFDLGLGRTFTHLVSKYRADDDVTAVGEVLTAGSVMIVALGVASAILVLLVCSTIWYASSFLPADITEVEWTRVSVLLALAVPFVVFSSGLRGVFEGFDRFAAINIIRTFAGAALFIAPMIVSHYTHRLDALVTSIVATRIVMFLVTYVVAQKLFFKQFNVELSFRNATVKWWKKIVTYGGWLSVSNIVGPVVVYLDRILIVSFLSAALLTSYTIPHDFITRFVSIPAALGIALFPVLSSGRHNKLPEYSLLLVGVISIPILLATCLFAEQILDVWLGVDKPEGSGMVLQLLCIGVLFNGYAQIPFVAIQSLDRADLTAKLHILELAVFGVVATLLISRYSLMGAAISWSLRAVVDCLALSIIYSVLNAEFRKHWKWIYGGLYLFSAVLFYFAIF